MSLYMPSDLRRIVHERAGGCCEYCLIPETVTLTVHEIDHIIALKHQGQTEESNLSLSCTLCNKHKGSDIASLDLSTGDIIALFNPRKDRWIDHFKIVDGHIMPLTKTGEVTARLLQLNTLARVNERILLMNAGLIIVPEQGFYQL